MATKTDAAQERQETVYIPLDKLKKSPRNARATAHTEAAIEALASSIQHRGMLQNLIVEPELDGDGKETGYYYVTAGEGRRLAQLLRVKWRKIKKTEPIRCVVDTVHDAHEVSLDENVTRTPMHPADQFEAFKRLSDEQGWGAEEIGARFGVSAHVVRQRLRLGAVSPVLMALYREEALTLEQLMAFAVTSDASRQEQVYDRFVASWGRAPQPYAIRSAMLEAHVEPDDPRAIFAREAYEAAGGEVVRDLFTGEGEGYLADVELLERLVAERLEEVAEEVRQEGWAWVEAHLDYPYSQGLGRLQAQRAELSARDRKCRERLVAEHEELMGRYEEGDDLTAEEEARFREVEDELDRLADQQEVYDPEERAGAGAYVWLGEHGRPRIARGFVRVEVGEVEDGSDDDLEDGEGAVPASFVGDDGRSDAPTGVGSAKPEPKSGMSDALVRDLTAHRTQALRLVLGDQPDVALTAITHALAAQVFFKTAHYSCLEVEATCTSLDRDASGIDDSPAGRAVAERHEAWQAQMPDDVSDLWAFVAGLDSERRLALLAHCAAATVFAVRQRWELKRGTGAAADDLAVATSLDMTQHWEPTAAGYFSRVSKPLILEAIREGASEEDATMIAPMKKHGMAAAAERKLAGKGWVPVILRSPAPTDEAAEADEEVMPEAA